MPGPSGRGLAGLPRDGELTIDNNLSERTLRAQALGRRNFLFVWGDRGGRTAATLYSPVGGCKRHRVDPFIYLRDALERLPAHPADQLGRILPDAWLETILRRDAMSLRDVRDWQDDAGYILREAGIERVTTMVPILSQFA